MKPMFHDDSLVGWSDGAMQLQPGHPHRPMYRTVRYMTLPSRMPGVILPMPKGLDVVRDSYYGSDYKCE